jgi:hypothetical protein
MASRLGLSGSRPVVRKASELRRLCDVTFDSSVLGIVSNRGFFLLCCFFLVGSCSCL